MFGVLAVTAAAEVKLSAWSNDRIAVETHRLTTQDLEPWSKFSCAVGPANMRDQFRVWVRSKESVVKGFVIRVKHESSGVQKTDIKTLPNDPENGSYAVFELPESTTRITGLSISELVEAASADVPLT